MTELPRELAAWRTTLSSFQPRLAVVLGDWLRRLAPLIGPIRVDGIDTGDEPDGYHGLIRRGHYERLLTSEWLMADEEPLEFLRRAAMGEQLFLHLVRREPRSALCSLALFDAGPSQLGAPRLAHLALLILLAERAMADGAEFHWGLVQGADEPLREGMGVDALRGFLDRRSPYEAGPQHLGAWRRRLEELEVDDFWVIGSRSLELADLSRSRVVVDDPLDPHRRNLAIRIEHRSRLAVDLELELPNAATCVQLLRRPFAANARVSETTGRTPAAGNAPVFSLNGHRLLVGAEGGGMVAYHIPPSANQAPGRARNFLPHPAESLVAVGYVGRRLLAATLQGRRLVTYGAGTAANRRRTNRVEIVLPPDLQVAALTENDRVTPCHYMPLDNGDRALVVVDRAGAVFLTCPFRQRRAGETSDGSAKITRLWQRTTAVAAVNDNLVAVVSQAGVDGSSNDRCVGILSPDGNVEELPIDPGDGDLKTCFGVGGEVAHPQAGLLAIRDREDSWLLIYGSSRRRLTPNRGARVVGVARSRQDGGAPALVTVDDDARSLRLVGLRFSRRIHRASHPILGAMTSGAQPYLAYRHEDGEIVVLSLVSHELVVRIRPAPTAEDGDE